MWKRKYQSGLALISQISHTLLLNCSDGDSSWVDHIVPSTEEDLDPSNTMSEVYHSWALPWCSALHSVNRSCRIKGMFLDIFPLKVHQSNQDSLFCKTRNYSHDSKAPSSFEYHLFKAISIYRNSIWVYHEIGYRNVQRNSISIVFLFQGTVKYLFLHLYTWRPDSLFWYSSSWAGICGSYLSGESQSSHFSDFHENPPIQWSSFSRRGGQ